VGLPAVSVGVIEKTLVNAGEVSNKGFEFGLNYQNNDHAFKYSVNANVATLTNQVNKLQTFVKSIIDDGTHTRTEVGQPISSYFGYQFEGIYQNAGEISKHLFSNYNGTQPGDIRFKDLITMARSMLTTEHLSAILFQKQLMVFLFLRRSNNLIFPSCCRAYRMWIATMI
jgi:hypothetical protein